MVVEFERGGGTKEACFRWLWNFDGGDLRRRHVFRRLWNFNGGGLRRRHVLGGCRILMGGLRRRHVCGGCGNLKGAFCEGDTAGSGVLMFLACGADAA